MALSSPLRPNLLLSVSAPLLFLFTGAPLALQDRLLRHLPKKVSKAQLVTVLTWALAAGLGSQINSWLTAWARNNWLFWGRGRGTKFGQNGWDKEVAVITGGSSGIGNLTARGLAAKGVKVCILDIAEPAEELDNISYFRCDITSPDHVREAADAVRSFFGPPTILVNNAGIAHAHTILNASPKYLRNLFDVNVISHFYTLQAFLPDMINRKKGHIVTLASMASYTGPPELVDYAASKAAVLAIHEGLVSELKHRYDAPEIKTTCVHPIYVRTNLISTWQQSLREKRALVIQPQTVADAIVNQILRGTSDQLFLPRWMSAGTLIRAFPWWLQEIVRDGLKNDVIGQESEKSDT